jgi:hypothetical protein
MYRDKLLEQLPKLCKKETWMGEKELNDIEAYNQGIKDCIKVILSHKEQVACPDICTNTNCNNYSKECIIGKSPAQVEGKCDVCGGTGKLQYHNFKEIKDCYGCNGTSKSEPTEQKKLHQRLDTTLAMYEGLLASNELNKKQLNKYRTALEKIEKMEIAGNGEISIGEYKTLIQVMKATARIALDVLNLK